MGGGGVKLQITYCGIVCIIFIEVSESLALTSSTPSGQP